jgi:hypothetical protein
MVYLMLCQEIIGVLDPGDQETDTRRLLNLLRILLHPVSNQGSARFRPAAEKHSPFRRHLPSLSSIKIPNSYLVIY